MNRRYMDFVPANKDSKPVKKASEPEQKILREELAVAKSRKIARTPVMGKGPVQSKGAVRAGGVTSQAKTSAGAMAQKKVMDLPRPAFVNVEKVKKRPLSKNVYTKTVEAKEEVPSGPVTIIDKSEKDSKVGLVVTIIITIILGAAAGTVAFLLLPK